MKRTLLLCFALAYFFATGHAQKNARLPLVADSLTTGNYKDVLNSFFQLAFNKLISDNKEIKFTSNPYAVMAKMDTSLLVDTNYYKYRRLRNLNFSFAARLDSSYKFNGFSSGVTYALINKRDETVSRVFLNMVADDFKVQELFGLNLDLEAYISSLSGTPDIQEKIRNQKTSFFKGEIDFSDLEPLLQEKIKQLAAEKNARYLLHLMEADAGFNMKQTSQALYDDYKNYFNNKLLWTVSLSDTTYKNQFMFSNVVLSSQVVKGLDSLKVADIELDIKTALQYIDDSLHAGRDLKRSVFSFEPGINFVMKTKHIRKSFFEFELGGSFYHTFSGLYQNEKRNRVTINAIARVRIINDIWIPLEIKYDAESGNVFGFLNVRANFTALGNIAKGRTD
jgi:hypothetical protein